MNFQKLQLWGHVRICVDIQDPEHRPILNELLKQVRYLAASRVCNNSERSDFTSLCTHGEACLGIGQHIILKHLKCPIDCY
jgi:hypothetical protein